MMEEHDDRMRPGEEVLLDLNFVPRWAKKEPGVNHYGVSDRPPRRDRDERRGRDARRGDGERRSRRPDGNSVPRRGDDAPHRAASFAKGAGQRSTERPEAMHRPRPAPLPVEIRFLPEQKMLSSLVRQIHHAKRAYPLIDLAHLFLAEPKGHLVKIEVLEDAGDFALYQGRKSKMTATSRDILQQQILDDHLEDFFASETIEGEPPSGSFPLIARVGTTLIGPPNHHSYPDRLAEMHRTRYAGMPFDRFKEKVQTVRDEELVEQWKKEASVRTVYRLRDGGDSREFSLFQASEFVRTHLVDAEIESVKRAVMPGTLARTLRDERLLHAVRDAFQRECRFPQTLSFALRAAFRHLHLHTFKAGRNINFITAVKPDPIRPEDAVDTIRCILEYLADHPGQTRQQLVCGLRPGAAPDSQEAHEILNPIRWLVERGHLIEFFNGTLSVPSRRRMR